MRTSQRERILITEKERSKWEMFLMEMRSLGWGCEESSNEVLCTNIVKAIEAFLNEAVVMEEKENEENEQE